ncbi:winged helix-turn-helix domain-containing protein [Armatimonas sp.]|uniref:winged helix-turn-helix domain-containing protein n=1 Tax=Armatimonas sp. TaxID=1872638 RepID=UPI00286C82DA|nr:winged helix-turn-helix domain-containing protein [Armatimonas sp.]
MAGKSGKENKKGKGDLAEVLGELAALREEIEAIKESSKSIIHSGTGSSAEQVARKASAFSPLSRAKLIETLLTKGPQTPSQLGETVGLATGSLYHHLREIVAAGIATVEAKNYRLTPEGERLARAFFDE